MTNIWSYAGAIPARGPGFTYDWPADPFGRPYVAAVPTTGTSGSAVSISNPLYVKGASYVPRGDQQITIATLQTKQTLTIPTDATVAILQNNTNQYLRWRDGPAGTDPTTTVGQRIAPGAPLTYDGNLAQFEIIAEAAGTGTLDIAYYS